MEFQKINIKFQIMTMWKLIWNNCQQINYLNCGIAENIYTPHERLFTQATLDNKLGILKALTSKASLQFSEQWRA